MNNHGVETMSSGNVIPQSVEHYNQKILLQCLQVLIGSLFIGLCAQIRIPLPFTPVPITLQTFSILLIARFLGSKKGTLAVFAYLCEILLGMPVLAGAFSKPLAFLGAHGGYLFGYIPLVYFSGWVLERRESFNQSLVYFSLILICFLQLLIGSLWLGNFVGMKNMFAMGFLPFIPGEILKVCSVMAFQKFRK